MTFPVAQKRPSRKKLYADALSVAQQLNARNEQLKHVLGVAVRLVDHLEKVCTEHYGDRANWPQDVKDTLDHT